MIKNMFDFLKFFKQDYMVYFGKEDCLLWKWLLIGLKNFGIYFYVDFFGISVWNRFLFGQKIWVFFLLEIFVELL